MKYASLFISMPQLNRKGRFNGVKISWGENLTPVKYKDKIPGGIP